MTIALIAHDAKKELMIQFCIAYCGVLSRHKLCATGTTGKLVSEATGLEIQRYLSGRQGGDQQIAARIAAMKLMYCCSSGIRSTARNRNRTKWHCSASAMSTMFRLQPILQQQKR